MREISITDMKKTTGGFTSGGFTGSRLAGSFTIAFLSNVTWAPGAAADGGLKRTATSEDGADENGEVTKTEVIELYDQADINGDGDLNAQEFANFLEAAAALHGDGITVSEDGMDVSVGGLISLSGSTSAWGDFIRGVVDVMESSGARCLEGSCGTVYITPVTSPANGPNPDGPR